MGRPKSESADSSRAEFNELLTFKGKVASASNPRLSGKRSFAADLRGYRIAAGPVMRIPTPAFAAALRASA